MSFLDVLIRNRAEILTLAVEHLTLVSAGMILAVGIGVPLGIVVTRLQSLGRLILGATNVVQTVPSLALFGFLIPIPLIGGIGGRSAIVAPFLYALLPIVRNTHAGLIGVDPAQCHGVELGAADVLRKQLMSEGQRRNELIRMPGLVVERQLLLQSHVPT